MTEEKIIKVKNIISFFAIIFGEDVDFSDFSSRIMSFSPDYLIEKYERYVLSLHDESEWGLHPLLKARITDKYFEKWGL